jgi:hypothetical protein
MFDVPLIFTNKPSGLRLNFQFQILLEIIIARGRDSAKLSLN